MNQQEIRPFNNVTYTIEEGAALVEQLHERTKHDEDGYNSIAELGLKVKTILQVVPYVENSQTVYFGNIGNATIHDYVNAFDGSAPVVSDVANWNVLTDNGTTYLFVCVIGGVRQTYKFNENSLPKIIAFGNDQVFAADFDLIASGGSGLPGPVPTLQEVLNQGRVGDNLTIDKIVTGNSFDIESKAGVVQYNILSDEKQYGKTIKIGNESGPGDLVELPRIKVLGKALFDEWSQIFLQNFRTITSQVNLTQPPNILLMSGETDYGLRIIPANSAPGLILFIRNSGVSKSLRHVSTNALINYIDANGQLKSTIPANRTLLIFSDGTNWLEFGFNDKASSEKYHEFACSDEISALAVGIVYRQRMMRPMPNCTSFDFSTITAPNGSTIIIDVHKNGSTVYTTKATIDSGKYSTLTATTAQSIIGGTVSFDPGDILEVIIDQVGSTAAGTNLKAQITYNP